MIYIIIPGVIVLLSLLCLIFLLKKKKLTIYDIKITESEQEIEALLDKKLSLLSELYKYYSEKEDNNFQFLCKLEEVEDDDFKLNKILNEAYRELKNFLDEKRSYIPSDDIKDTLNDLFQCDTECTAVKNYYNDIITKYNKNIQHFPNNIVAKIMHLDKKELYNDPKEEEFEILKNK